MSASRLPPAPLDQGLRAAVAQITTGSVSVAELVNACLRRIGERDADLHAMVHVDVDGALVRAAELDQQLRDGAAPLPLHGVPVIVKEIISVAGMPDSAGSRLATPELFAGEGPFVRALRAAGCVILGKSLSTEFALGQYNLARTMPVNPLDPDTARATGGSSAGSAAALAAGYCGFTVGTDTGGSVRAPAAMCGLVGFKPAADTWSTAGVFPLSAQLDSIGLLTRSVDDARFVFQALTTVPETNLDPAVDRIGVPQTFFFDDLDEAIAAAVREALLCINAAGIECVPLTLPPMDAVADYFANDLPLELLDRLGRARVIKNIELLDPLTAGRLGPVAESGQQQDSHIILARLQLDARRALAAGKLRFWLTPTVPGLPLAVHELKDQAAVLVWQARASRNTRCINALDMAAVTLPISAGGRLAAGLQLVGARGDEPALMELAARLEQILAPLRLPT